MRQRRRQPLLHDGVIVCYDSSTVCVTSDITFLQMLYHHRYLCYSKERKQNRPFTRLFFPSACEKWSGNETRYIQASALCWLELKMLNSSNYECGLALQVGPTYGRKTMTGLLSSHGLHVSQKRVGDSLQRTNPGYQHARRTATARKMNTIPYDADYFGHKVHVDQNEKLAMFGVTL